MLWIESPPNSKKLSWRPMGVLPSTAAQIAARRRSSDVPGASKTRLVVSADGAGSARRSILPLAFNGMRSSTRIWAGTM
jgi:hypothetical protein